MKGGKTTTTTTTTTTLPIQNSTVSEKSFQKWRQNTFSDIQKLKELTISRTSRNVMKKKKKCYGKYLKQKDDNHTIVSTQR